MTATGCLSALSPGTIRNDSTDATRSTTNTLVIGLPVRAGRARLLFKTTNALIAAKLSRA